MTSLTWRHSPLAARHRELGSLLEPWNGMETAWTYSVRSVADEHEAVRTAAALIDVSGLRKVHIHGPHSHQLLHRATTRDVRKIYPGRSAYACMLTDGGKFTDDCLLYRTGPNSWFVVVGSGNGYEELLKDAAGKSASVIFDDDLQDLSLQGPKSVDLLRRHIPNISALQYFHHIQTTLFGKDVMLSRTGYSGERGYEIFCRSADATEIWDGLLADGQDLEIIPASFTVLDWLRVESSLLFYPYDNSQLYPFENEPAGDTLWELGLQFTVSPGKTDFRGYEEHIRLKGRERFKIFGVLCDMPTPAAAGDLLFHEGRRVGVITAAMHSRATNRSMAIARIAVDAATHGMKLDVRGAETDCRAIAHTLPFDDPGKKKRTAA